MFRVKETRPPLTLRFESLTGLPTHALRKNPRDTLRHIKVQHRTFRPGAGVWIGDHSPFVNNHALSASKAARASLS